MPYQFFSPKADGTGAALFVSFNSKDGNVYFKLIKQTGWNDQTKKGSFVAGEMINFKMSQDEACDVIQTIRNQSKCSFYHSFDGKTTTGSFQYYRIPSKVQGKDDKEGYGLTIKRDNTVWKVGFNLASGERLSQSLLFALDHIFSAIYSQDKKENEEYMKTKAAPTPAPAPQPRTTKPAPKPAASKPAPKPAPAPEPEVDDFATQDVDGSEDVSDPEAPADDVSF